MAMVLGFLLDIGVHGLPDAAIFHHHLVKSLGLFITRFLLLILP